MISSRSFAKTQSAFTLLEVLVAVTISAMIGVGAFQALNAANQSEQSASEKNAQLKSLQRFNQVVSRDLGQFINRGVTDGFSEERKALLLDDGDYLIEWTRLGWRNNPMSSDYRSELQRVAYQVYDIDDEFCASALLRFEQHNIETAGKQCLVRFYWQVLDQSSSSEAKSQVLVDDIENLEIEVFSKDKDKKVGASKSAYSGGAWFSQWPSLDQTSGVAKKAHAVRWRFELPGFGEMERVWEISNG